MTHFSYQNDCEVESYSPKEMQHRLQSVSPLTSIPQNHIFACPYTKNALVACVDECYTFMSKVLDKEGSSGLEISSETFLGKINI